MVAKKGFTQPDKGDYLYPYPVYYRSPIHRTGNIPASSKGGRTGGMGLATVIRDYGTDILNAIRECDVQKLKFILEKTLRSDAKIAKLCVTDIKHKPSKKFACPLILAARQEDPRIMQYMMDKGTDPSFVHHTIFTSKRRETVTALHIAVDLGYYKTAEVLLNANADKDIYDHSRETPLHIAVKKADHTMVRLLLSKGADPTIPDRKDNAALHIATLYGHLQMVRTLLKYDADIYQKGQWNAIAPHIAAKEGHIHLLQLFCSKDIGNINVMIPCYLDQREKAPIHLAAENGHAECLLVLLDQFDADVNVKDSDGNTPLHCVVLHPYDNHRMRDKEYFTESARVLINFRVSINEKNMFGDTALHFAAMNHHHRIVELLLQMGANPFLENEDGLKPVDTVPDSDPVTKQILKRAMAQGRQHFIDMSMSMDMSMTPNSSRRMGSVHGFERMSKLNISQRSGSSMSSFYPGDMKSRKPRSRSQIRERRESREFEGRRSRSVDVLEQRTENSHVADDEESVASKVEKKSPVYTKVNKKEKDVGGKKKPKLNYDQREWDEISTSVMNDDDSSVFTHDDVPMMTTASVHKPPSTIAVHKPPSTIAVQQVEVTTEPSPKSPKRKGSSSKTSSSQSENAARKTKKTKTQQPSIEKGMDLDVPINIDPVPAPRRPNGEVVYENLPPVEAPPPLPPRKGRIGTYDSQNQLAGESQGEMQGEYREENGVQVHTVPGKPSTIEVQYKGGPITISVDTPKDYYKDSDEEESSDEESFEEAPKPVKHRKHKESPSQKQSQVTPPKSKKRDGRSKHSEKTEKIKYYEQSETHVYENQEEMRSPKSPKQKSSSRKQKKALEEQEMEEAQPYYNSYYDKNVPQKKGKTKPKAKPRTSNKYYEASESFDQTLDDQENTTLDISGMSMMSSESQPELVKRIIQMKVAEITDESTQSHKSSEQAWMDDDESDDENILDSDEWQSAEEDVESFPEVTPLKPEPKVKKDKRETQQNYDQELLQQQEKRRQQEEKQQQEKRRQQEEKQQQEKRRQQEEKQQQEKRRQQEEKQQQEKRRQQEEKQQQDKRRQQEEKQQQEKQQVPFSPKREVNKYAQSPQPTPKVAEVEKPKPAPQPKPKEQPHPNKTKPAINIRTKPASPIQITRADESASHDDEVSVSPDDTPNASPKPMTFKEKLAFARAMEQRDSDTPLGSPQLTPKKPQKPSEPQQPPVQIPKWKMQPTQGSLVVENVESTFSETTSEGRSKDGLESSSRAGDGDDEREDSSEISDLSRRLKGQPGTYPGVTAEVDVQSSYSSASSVKAAPPAPAPKPMKKPSQDKIMEMQAAIDNIEKYEGSPFSRRKFDDSQQTEQSESYNMREFERSDMMEYESEPFGDRHRSKSFDGRERDVSPVSLGDMRGVPRSMGIRTPDSTMSEGRGLGLRVVGDVPKAYNRNEKEPARRDFMKAKPARIESSSDASDSEMFGSRGSLTDLSIKDRGKLWAEPLLKPPKSKSPLSATSTSPKPDSSKSDDGSEDSSQAKHVKLMGGYAKPYKSFGKIEVNTDLIEEAMLNASIPEDPESLSDLEAIDDQPPLPDTAPPPPNEFPSHLLTPESPKVDMSEFSRPQTIKMQEFDAEPGQRRSHPKMNRPSEHPPPPPETITTTTTTVVKSHAHHPQIDALKAEHGGSTEDLSFGDSTFDLDELVTQNAAMGPPSELPPPPPELMDEEEQQEEEPKKTPEGGVPKELQRRNSAYVEEIDEEELEAFIKKEAKKAKKKGKTRKSIENLAEADQDAKSGKAKKKKKKPKDKQAAPSETTTTDTTSDVQVPSEETSSQANTEVTAEESVNLLGPGEPDVNNEEQDEMLQYDAEPGSRRRAPRDPRLKTLEAEPEKIDQSMTDIEVAQITDAAEARRRAREEARRQREWHKNQQRGGSLDRIRQRSQERDQVPRQKSVEEKPTKHGSESGGEEHGSPWRKITPKVTPSPTRRHVTPSPNSYTIVVEGGAEITTSRGKLPTGKSSGVQGDKEHAKNDDQEQGALLSFGSKREKKKKTRKSTDNLLEDGSQDPSSAQKKKKKKKTGSRDDLSQIESSEKKKKKKKKPSLGSQEDLAGKTGLPQDSVVVSEVWKEAMESQPLASSDMVYGAPTQPSAPGSGPPSSKKKTRKKRRKSSGSDQSSDHGHHDELGDLVKHATVPQVRKPFNADVDEDMPEEINTGAPPTIELSDAHKAAMRAAREAMKKEKELMRMSQGINKQVLGSDDDDDVQDELMQLTKPPQPGAKPEPPRSQHAVTLQQQTQLHEAVSSDDELAPGMVKKASIPKPRDTGRKSYGDDSDSSVGSSHGNQAPVIGLTESQKAKVVSKRGEKDKKKKKKKKAKQLGETEQVMEVEVTETVERFEMTKSTTEKSKKSKRPKHAMDLNKPGAQLDMEVDDDQLPGNLVNRATIPVMGTGEDYDMYEEDDYDEDIGEDMQPVLDIDLKSADIAEIKRARELKRVEAARQQRELAEEKERQMQYERQQREEQEFGELSGPPRPGNIQRQPQRPQHAIQLSGSQQTEEGDMDYDESFPNEFSHRAAIPHASGRKPGSYDTNIDDYDEDMSQEMGQVPVIGLGATQKEAMLKARQDARRREEEEMRQRKLQEQDERKKMEVAATPPKLAPKPAEKPSIPSRPKHAINLKQDKGSSQSESDSEDSDAKEFVQHAGVPVTPQNKQSMHTYDRYDDEEIGEEGAQVPVMMARPGSQDAKGKLRESKRQKQKQEKKKKKKMHEEQEAQKSESSDSDAEEQKEPEAPKVEVKPRRPQYAMDLNQPQGSRPAYEDNDDEYVPESLIHRAKVSGGGKKSFETNLDDFEAEDSSEFSENLPVLQVGESQKAAMASIREAKRQKQVQIEKQKALRQQQERESELQRQKEMEEQMRQHEESSSDSDEDEKQQRKPVKPQRPQYAINLNQPQKGQKEFGDDDEDESIPESLIHRVQVTAGQKKSFETNLDDYDPDDSSEFSENLPVLQVGDSQKAAMANIREAKRQKQIQIEKQQALKLQAEREAELRRQEELQAQMARQEISSESDSEEERKQKPVKPQRPQYAIDLNQPQNAQPEYDDDEDEHVPDELIHRAQVEKSRKKSFETNLDDFEAEELDESLPVLELGDSQKAAMQSIREAKRQHQLQIEKQKALKLQQEKDAELKRQQEIQRLEEAKRQLELTRQAQKPKEQPPKPPKPQFAMKLDQPHNKYQDDDTEEMPGDDLVQRARVPDVGQTRGKSFETNIDDFDSDEEESAETGMLQMRGGKPSQHGVVDDKEFRNAAFAKLREMQGGNKPAVSKKPHIDFEDEEMVEEKTTTTNFSRAQVGRVSRGRPKKGQRPSGLPPGGKEIYIDGPPELMGEDALPPGGDVDEQLRRDRAALSKAAQSTSPMMSELWKGKKDQEIEMHRMLQSIQDPSELDPSYSKDDSLQRGKDPRNFRGRLPQPPAGSPQLDRTPESSEQQTPPSIGRSQKAPGPYRPPPSPLKSDKRPPRGPSLNDSQSSMNESPQRRPPRTIDNRVRTLDGRHRGDQSNEGPYGPMRPRSSSEGRPQEYRQRSASEGRPPNHQPIRRRVRKPYPDGDSFNQGHQSDSEATRHRRSKTISFYGDYRSDNEISRRSRDRAPKMKPSLSLEEAAWKQIRADMDQQPKLQPHRVIKRKSDTNINYTRGIYRPTPVYWRGSQRSLANTSRYGDSELISQLWNERHRSMNTESEGEGYDEDVSYGAYELEDSQYAEDGQQYVDEEGRVRSVSMYDTPPPPVPTTEPPYNDRYFPRAFHPVGPPKKVTIMDKRKKKYKDPIDKPPKFLNPGPVDFNKYGTTAKLWMEQVDRSNTQKSQTMYLSTLKDGKPPPELAGSLPTDDHPTEGSQWVIARGRSLQQRKAIYDEQLREGDRNASMEIDPGKQMLLFFKIGENWKDLTWVLFDGLQSDGETLRMLKEIQHRHPDKVNDQVHDMMHRWWKKKGSSATIEELQKALEFLKMAYVEEEYMNQRGIFSDAEPDPEQSTASEDDAEVNRLIHDYKNRSLNASYDAPHPITPSPTVDHNNSLNTGVLLRKLEEATIEHIPARIHRPHSESNRGSLHRTSTGPPDNSHLDFETGGDGTHQHSFLIVQPQLRSSDYKHETNM